jgi:hypothetical protein
MPRKFNSFVCGHVKISNQAGKFMEKVQFIEGNLADICGCTSTPT